MIEYICEFSDHPNINDKGALREKVVRCRDCKHYRRMTVKFFKRHTCTLFSTFIEPNGFCAWAKKEEK